MDEFCRVQENKKLDDFLKSNRAEFLAIYGRRRVGKTFLIKNYFGRQKCLFLPITGIEDGTFSEQRTECVKQISNVFYNGAGLSIPCSWFDIFEVLNKAIDHLPKSKKIVLFFDEFPWLATPRSRLLQALEYYWNQYWSNNKNVKLIICGSLASWIMKNIINNTGGLYNRVTYRMKLDPFNLYETQEFLKKRHIHLTKQQILSIYMVTGGIPLYLEQVKKGLSANQIVDQICFNKNGMLINEIKELFQSLFLDSDIYIKLTREIAKHRYGISKSILAKRLKMPQSGRFSDRLKELEDAGFVMSFLPYNHREKGAYFRVIDEYAMFYFYWIEPNVRSMNGFAKSKGFWIEQAESSAYKSWCGYAFESVCYKHIMQIIRALNLKASSLPYSWRFSARKGENEHGAQIDLLFDRSDDAITLCEIKHTSTPFTLDKDYAKKLKRKIVIFKEKTKTKKQIFFTIISSSGVKNTYYLDEIVDSVVTLEDLFQQEE